MYGLVNKALEHFGIHLASREAGAEREEFLVEWGGAGSA